MILLFIGPSGSGKDTQADYLVKNFGYTRISSGDFMRQISDGESDIQKMIRQSMNEGFLADNFVFGLLQIYLQYMERQKIDNIVLSGVVRRDTQIELLDYTLFKVNKKLDKVVYFNLSDEEAVRRMSNRVKCENCSTNYNLIYDPPKVSGICDKCGGKLSRREDDNPESIKARLVDFHKDNDEIIGEYEKRGILVRIDAGKNIEEISKEVKEGLGL